MHCTQTNLISSNWCYQQWESLRNPALRGSWLSSWAPSFSRLSWLPSPSTPSGLGENLPLWGIFLPEPLSCHMCIHLGVLQWWSYEWFHLLPLLFLRRNQKLVPIFLVLAKGNLVILTVLSCPGPQTQRSLFNQTFLSQMTTLITGCLMTHLMLQLHQVKHSTNESMIITIMASSLQNRSLTSLNICLALYYYLS